MNDPQANTYAEETASLDFGSDQSKVGNPKSKIFSASAPI
jgi:hypothetical protein